jgi:hypothetical protein
MELRGELAISLLDLLGVRAARDTELFVEIDGHLVT